MIKETRKDRKHRKPTGRFKEVRNGDKMTNKRLATFFFFQLTIKEKAAKNKPSNSFVVLFIFF